ncbi:MAG: glutamate mutase L [Clostridia bacterium]|nr:glutamate mutase L [Clostridia bacterium]
MKNILLIDFGSTYTKLTAVDVEAEEILGTSASFTTIFTDINEGLRNALAILEKQIGKVEYDACYACSSAAGGLRMVTSGLVPELTGEAAKLASLGAGAKVVGVYAFQLTDEDIEEIKASKPDILLLVGGTDGGNTECITHNAKMMASLDPALPIIIAGNRTAVKECQSYLEGHEVYVCPNVMPKFGVLNAEPTQKKIREIFLDKIVEAKGLKKASELLSDIMMPTPSAVLAAMELLSKGCENELGIGELVAVDVGGATTDIYSIADGMPEHMNTVYKGLPEPYAKRTVEGDIGMRYSIQGIVDAAGIGRISSLSGIPEDRALELIAMLKENTDIVPGDDKELEALDFALASCAIDEAVTRHAGSIYETFTMMGQTFVQEGKNLTKVGQIVVTGGSLIHTKRTVEIASNALATPNRPQSLKPRQADVWVDRKYIMAAMGLLSTHYPEVALRIMKKELEYHGYSK